jgi:hypothetical protein
MVVVDGVDRLRDGARIRVRDSDNPSVNGSKAGRDSDARHQQRGQK